MFQLISPDETLTFQAAVSAAGALGGAGGPAAAALARLTDRGRPVTSDPLSDPSFSDLSRLRHPSVLTETVSRGVKKRRMVVSGV